MKWLLLLLLLSIPCQAQESFENRVDQFLAQAWWPARPTDATATGFHQYDEQFEDWSQSANRDQIQRLHQFREIFRGFPASDDREILLSAIDSALLELEEVRMWEKDPNRYAGQLNSSAFALMNRKFAEPATRLRALIAREKRMPAFLEQARANITNPPAVYLEVARLQADSIRDFFQDDVPAAFAEVKDTELLRDFAASNQAVLAALSGYSEWLNTLKGNGDFRLGEKLFLRKLQSDEMVDMPLDRLLQIGRENLKKNQMAYQQTAAKLYPGLTREQVTEKLADLAPPPDRLLAEVRRVVRELPDFLESHQIVTLPSRVLPIVMETPPFLRALTFASMDTPGPYEERAKEAYFHITLPDPSWSPERVREHMAGFSMPVIVSTATHEAYPGHYVQFMWARRAPSKVRKLFSVGTNFEGWAHYCEEMMLDEGYGLKPGQTRESPEFLTLRMGQLQDALLRNCRYVVGIQMHRGAMSVAEGEQFFVQEGYQSASNALAETRRGTSDPTYLMYTLGKLEILKLREDFRRQKGDDYRLKDFHDKFLAQGAPPLRIVRRAFGLQKESEL